MVFLNLMNKYEGLHGLYKCILTVMTTKCNI